MACRKLSKHLIDALRMNGEGVPSLQERARRLAMSITLSDPRNIEALLERAHRYQGVDPKEIEIFRAFVQWVETSPDAQDSDRELASRVQTEVLSCFNARPNGNVLYQ